MASQKFKYKLVFLLKELPRTISVKHIEDILREDHGISRDTFYQDRNLKIGDDFSVPIERLEIYSSLLGVTVDELKNYRPKKIKPLIQRRRFSKDEVKAITGLKTPTNKVSRKKLAKSQRLERAKSIAGLKSKS